MLSSFPVPAVDSISFIPVQSACTIGGVQSADDDSKQLVDYLRKQEKQFAAYFLQFDHVKSAFVEVNLFADTQTLTAADRQHLELYLELMFSLPIDGADGKRLAFEEVVKLLDRDTVSYGNSVGVDGGGHASFSVGSFGQTVAVCLKAEITKYERTVQWLYDSLWRAVFTEERIKIAAAKLLNDIPGRKRDGMKVFTRLAIRSTVHHLLHECRCAVII
jgi:Zn-dependent M16 (insulinase) family peptidase